MTANQKLFDLTLRRQIAVRKYSEGVIQTMLEHLSEVDARLSKKLQADLTESGRARLKTQLRELAAMRQALWSELSESTKLDLEQLAKMEAEWENQALKQSVPIELSLASMDIDRIKAAALAQPFQGATMAQWFKDLAQKDVASLTRAITLGVTEGQTVDQLIQVVRGTKAANFADGILSTSRRHAETIVRTATNHVSQVARNEVWTANSDIVRALRWTSTLDGRTSIICQSRDGQLVPMNDKTLAPGERALSPSSARPPAHPNCRSLMVAVLDGVGIVGERPTVTDVRTRERREVDFRKLAKEQGKTVQEVRAEWAAKNVGRAPAATNYEAWLRTQDKEFQDKVLGPTRGVLFRQGTSIGDFVNASGTVKRVATLSKDAAAPNIRAYIRRELLKGEDWKDVLSAAQAAFPDGGVSPQQVGSIRKALQNSGMLSVDEVPAGPAAASQALDEFQASLPGYIQEAAPAGWANIAGEIAGGPPGAHTLHKAGGGVTFSAAAVSKMSADRAKATYAAALGRLLRDQAIGPLPEQIVTQAYGKASLKDIGPLGLSGEVLMDELLGLALHQGTLTSWGTPAPGVLLHFADEIKALSELLEKSLAPKKPVPPASAASFPVTGHKTVATYAKVLLKAGKSVEDVIAASKWYFPDTELTTKTVQLYKAQLASAEKAANMPSKAEVKAALEVFESSELSASKIKKKMAALKEGKTFVGLSEDEKAAAVVLSKAFGSFAKLEAKLAPKVTAAPVPTPVPVAATPVPVTAAVQKAELEKLVSQFNSMGPTSKKAVAAATDHIKVTGSVSGAPEVMSKVFGTFDPEKGKPLLDMAQKFAGLENPPWAQLKTPQKQLKTPAVPSAPDTSSIVPNRPAATPSEGWPPPPRFTPQQKIDAAKFEFSGLLKSPISALTDSEYTVLHNYTSSWYHRVNPKLAEPGKYQSDFLLQALAETAVEALAKLPAPPSNKVLFRNMAIRDLDALLSRYVPGSVVEETRFVSTSTDGQFGSGRNVSMKFVRHKTGRSVVKLSRYPGENEVLFPPGAKFRILSVKRIDSHVDIEVEEV